MDGNRPGSEGVSPPRMEATLMEPAAVEDASLVQETLAGSQASFQTLARHYTRNPVDIEDLVQETFLKAYGRLDSFQHQSSFFTWLYRIAVNTILDSMKRRGRSPVQAVEDPEVLATPAPTQISGPSSGIEREEITRITHEVLDELPEIFRTVLVMREFEDLAYQDIADVLGISIGTVESRLFRARARFKERLLQKHPEFGQE